MIGVLRAKQEGSLDDDAEGLSALGLPFGIEPPPPSRRLEIDWAREADECAQCGIPQGSAPLRPLYIEEAAQRLFEADNHDFSKWASSQAGKRDSLRDSASELFARREAERVELSRQMDDCSADIAVQRDQLVDQDLKYPRTAAGIKAGAIVATVLLGALEVFLLQPVVGQVFDVSEPKAWGMAAVIAAGIAALSTFLGTTLHRSLMSEGPARIRRPYVAGAAIAAVFSVAVLVGLTGIRILARSNELTSASSPIMIGLTFAAVQGAFQLGGIAHGWWRHNPRVRQLAASEVHHEQLSDEFETCDEACQEAASWKSSLDDWDHRQWIADHRASLASDYTADVLTFRGDLQAAHLTRKNLEAVEKLDLLPMPVFVPPVETDLDAGDWLTGFVLPL